MKYCVYITTYKGDKLPTNYIGSSSVDRVNDGYRGSVQSKKWKSLWQTELQEHPDLFHTEIISTHDTREDALNEELRKQLELNVVKSTEWINESYAQVNGYAGRDVSGSNNPMYGRGDRMTEWCKNNPEKVSQRNRKAANTQWADEHTRQSRIDAMKGKSKTRKTLTDQEFSEMQHRKSLVAAEKRMKRIYYNGVVYIGWKELFDKTGITKYRFIKHNMGNLQ